MDREALIRLDLERQDNCVLVSSPQFPLLHLAITDASEAEITRCVLPILKEMVEFRVGEPVTLRLVESFQNPAKGTEVPQPHVIASKQAAHVERYRSG
jgi:hypothetical protein